ncbi:MAG: glutamine--tRNA ligase, partial [Candidatus Latescibacteria bacterium]|nr:glutamine--tRNA ligase [Candidatus Latescibacterota bacterium]
DWLDILNPFSLETLATCYLEPALAELKVGEGCQFERLGYFCVDPDSTSHRLVFNRTVALRDAWSKVKKKGG